MQVRILPQPQEVIMNKEEAIRMAESKFWEDLTHRQIAEFQLFEPRLCMPWNVFHEAVSKSLGRDVFSHEFGLDLDGLKKELMGEKKPPTLAESISLIPEDKRVILCVVDYGE
jgi:hypothetical protein